ncbi:IPT/TIG domain-containing protein [Niastella yeongjuensis]|nr:IPT/TIG domain-containing protein [Niastella yeongjuensis]
MNYFKNTTSYIAIIFFAGLLVFSACKKEKGMDNPTASQLSPLLGAAGDVLTLTGDDLANIQTIVFEKDNVPCLFNPTLNTANAVIFRVPDTASGGDQNIVLTNIEGKQVSVQFNVLALPRVTEASNYNFTGGTVLELTGRNFEVANKVVLHGTTDEATILSQSKTKLVIKMPSTNVVRAKLDITNPTGTSVTGQEFVYIPNNFIVFDDDWGKDGAYGIGSIQSWSFSCNPSISTAVAPKAGTAVLRADYTDAGGGLSTFLGCSWTTNNNTFNMVYKMAFITFWARTEAADVDITIVPDNPWKGTDPFGAATGFGSKTVTLEKGKWMYFKIPADFISGDYSRLNFKTTDKAAPKTTIYYDDIILVK